MICSRHLYKNAPLKSKDDIGQGWRGCDRVGPPNIKDARCRRHLEIAFAWLLIPFCKFWVDMQTGLVQIRGAVEKLLGSFWGIGDEKHCNSLWGHPSLRGDRRRAIKSQQFLAGVLLRQRQTPHPRQMRRLHFSRAATFAMNMPAVTSPFPTASSTTSFTAHRILPARRLQRRKIRQACKAFL